MSRPRIVLLGDSITVGWHRTGVTTRTSYPSVLKERLCRAGADVEVIVSALHGVYMKYATRRFERMVGRHKPDYVVILLGANDAVPPGGNLGTSVKDYREALAALVSQCVLFGAIPIVTSPLPRADLRSQSLLRSYADSARNLAKRADLPFVDLFAELANKHVLAELLPDCQHPNSTGNTIIAELVFECLLPILRRSV